MWPCTVVLYSLYFILIVTLWYFTLFTTRIFIVHLGVLCSWYTQDYFLQMSKMSEWANEQNEQMSKHFYSFKIMSKIFYSFKIMSKHFYYKMSKRVNKQNAHMSKFGVKWAPEILIYYKNTPGCTMLMVHPGVPWVNSFTNFTLTTFVIYTRMKI